MIDGERMGNARAKSSFPRAVEPPLNRVFSRPLGGFRVVKTPTNTPRVLIGHQIARNGHVFTRVSLACALANTSCARTRQRSSSAIGQPPARPWA